jgi:hypothetical protein
MPPGAAEKFTVARENAAAFCGLAVRTVSISCESYCRKKK